ncbi:PREDICTED: G-protein coupled receptor family C group 5 member C-like [Nanorana parkeri]|uniref:G-protein coupled receptor family C group 5 member C-like n=1 Tax=Nanorana parkeri TaxID=125878 RepID=UPI00085502DE|nr:PREDICTED: G-protein coupled receptor family C group 5 member C-like [Nanorana parkeri]
MAHHRHLIFLCLVIYAREAIAQNSTSTNPQNISVLPPGCGQDVTWIFFSLCDLKAAWGIILISVAALGILCTIILILICIALAPSVSHDERKGALALNFLFLSGVFGLFSLVFAFVIAPNSTVCIIRRFLFGVVFAKCFACLVAHSVRLNYLVLQNRGPGGCLVFLLAIGLFLVEAVINMEWLLITNVRQTPQDIGHPCNITNQDFVTALVYVMFLIVASLVIPCPVLRGHYLQWKRHGRHIVSTAFLSLLIWVAWIVMYLYGNEKLGHESWDDPVLAIALASNAWVFILFYAIPQLVEMTRSGYKYEGDRLNIMNRHSDEPPSIIMENRAFSMDNPDAVEPASSRREQNKPVSPYSNYTGLYPTLPLHPAEVDSVNQIPVHLPRISMEPWRYHL